MFRPTVQVLFSPSLIASSDVMGAELLTSPPFDMNGAIPELVGTRVPLDGRVFEIRGIVSAASAAQIRTGEVIELLVLAM